MGDRYFDQIEEGISRCVHKLTQTSLTSKGKKIIKLNGPKFSQLINLGGKVIILKEWIPGTQL